MSDAKKRAYVLADNQIALNAGWDSELLAFEIEELSVLLPEIDLDLEITGFETGEIDLILSDHEDPAPSPTSEDQLPEVLMLVPRGEATSGDWAAIVCSAAMLGTGRRRRDFLTGK